MHPFLLCRFEFSSDKEYRSLADIFLTNQRAQKDGARPSIPGLPRPNLCVVIDETIRLLFTRSTLFTSGFASILRTVVSVNLCTEAVKGLLSRPGFPHETIGMIAEDMGV
ncbi:hypothetical protein AKJ16_DCAP01843 [Drosera capensis]